MILGKVRRKFTICVVDNDLLRRHEIARVLDSLDIYIPIVCSSFYEAIEEYSCYTLKGVPDLIISEWYEDFCDPDFLKIFHDSPLAIIRIIILTEGSRSKTVRMPCKMPVVGILKKPVRTRDIRCILKVI